MTELAAQLEGVLFAAGEPLAIAALIAATDHPQEDVETALHELAAALEPTGLALQQHAGRWQLVTAGRAAEAIKRHLSTTSRTELSRPALETLAMIAYRGPVSRSELDELRGVSSDAMLRNLLQRGLIAEQSTRSSLGQTTGYVVSHRFLEHVGLTSLAELPPLEDAPDSPEPPAHAA